MSDSFPPEVAKELAYYVFRLVDPHNGETFYAGKGTGNRVFAHARGERKLSPTNNADPETKEDPEDVKLKIIRAIRTCRP